MVKPVTVWVLELLQLDPDVALLVELKVPLLGLFLPKTLNGFHVLLPEKPGMALLFGSFKSEKQM